MIYHVTLAGKEHIVDVKEIEADLYRVVVDGAEQIVDAQKSERAVFSLLVNGRSHEANVTEKPGGFDILIEGDFYNVAVIDERRRSLVRQGEMQVEGTQVITAQMPGKVVAILAVPGQRVEPGQGILVLEAMKMENEIKSPIEGEVKEIAVEVGTTVESGQKLAVVE
jgi:biotin carboxyl carrier protein